MARSTLLSTRLRCLVPAAAFATGIARMIPVAAQDENRGQAPDESSSGTTASSSDALQSLLTLVPVSLVDTSADSLWIMFGDMAAQLAAGGIEPPASVNDEDGMHLWINASYPIAIADPFRANAFRLTRDVLGFDVTDIDQSIEFGAPPETCTLFRGRFQPSAIEAAWEVNGYQLIDVDGITVASIGEKGEIDLGNEINQIALARMNNVAILPDGTLAYAPTLDLMKSVIQIAQRKEESLADDRNILELLQSLSAPLASAIFFAGSALSIESQIPVDADPDLVDLVDSFAASPRMPEITLGLVGMTPGGPTLVSGEEEEPVIEFPPATIAYRLLMAEPGSAEDAAPIVVDRLKTLSSLVTAAPLSELYDLLDVTPLRDGNVLGVDLRPAEGRSVSIWSQSLFTRDLLFLAW